MLYFKKIAHCIVLFSVTFNFFSAYAIGDLQMPRINVVDKFGVNMATGQVTTHLDTLSIGGDMGLTHAIDGFTNNFVFIGGYGYQDKYAKYAKYRMIGERTENYDINTGNPLYALTVSDLTETKRFVVLKNGELVPNASGLESGFVYAALEDARHTLEVDSDPRFLKWTKPDGTLVYFQRAAKLHAGTEGVLKKIVYPNGFTIELDDSAHSNVRTNTGFLLHYEFAGHSKNMDKQDTYIEGVTNNYDWDRNPTKVIGVNASIESCPTAGCALTQNWPATTFTWPGGMPKTLYINYPISSAHPEQESGILSVKDAQGKTTEYHFRAEDLRLTPLGESIIVRNPPYFAPRLAGIKTADSKIVNIKYTYANIGHADVTQGENKVSYIALAPDFILSTEVGQILTASKNGEFNSYDINSSSFPNIRITSSGPVKKAVTNAFFGGNLHMPGDSNNNTFEVETLEGGTAFENSWRNAPVVFRSNSGYYEYYYYDGRGNLREKKRVNITKTKDLSTSAIYPTLDECTTILNSKTCNQPKSITDADGKTTAYQYHAESGQIARIILPANSQGVAPVTRFHYAQYRAKYYQANGKKEEGTPIWLKDSEKTCISTATLDDSCSGGENDEIVKIFEYEHDNLLLTGTTITAYDPNQKKLVTKRSCFQYDRLGNKIGESAPKANLNRCTQ